VLPKPAFLATSLTIGSIVFPAYRVFVIATGIVVALLLWLVLERTTLRGMVRAGVDDEEMARGLGINTPRLDAPSTRLTWDRAGSGPALPGPRRGFVSPAELSLVASAEGLLMVIVGGAGTLFGPALGAAVVVFLRNLVSAYTERWLLVLGLIYLLVVLCAPHGILGALQARLPEQFYRRAEP
jgi:branched-chain amino acid transport system permease protein